MHAIGAGIGEECPEQQVGHLVTGAGTTIGPLDLAAGELQIADRIQNLVTYEFVL